MARLAGSYTSKDGDAFGQQPTELQLALDRAARSMGAINFQALTPDQKYEVMEALNRALGASSDAVASAKSNLSAADAQVEQPHKPWWKLW